MHTPRKNHRASHPVHTPLRAVSPEEVDSWSDGDSDATLSDPQPVDLDEPWPYTFRVSILCESLLICSTSILIPSQAGDIVWVRTVGGNWHSGKVTGQTTRKGQTREVTNSSHFVLSSSFLFIERRPFLSGRIQRQTPQIFCAAEWRD
jgi:hypothetical protein